MRILVTGGAGFIGSNFITYMINKYPDYEIINLDALTYAGNLENLKHIQDHPKYLFIKGDIADPRIVDDVFQRSIDIVINFAAESHVDKSISDPGVFIRTNVMGTHVLLEAARKYRVGKFIHISTDEVYGTLGDTGLFTETTPLAPNSPYSASKAGSDLLVRSYHETYGLNINITRCSNNYGPYQFPEKLIPLMITNALQNKELPVYGDGLNVRDWIHVKDHCSAIETVMLKGKNGEIYNIGGRNERTNIEIVKTILIELGKPESLITYVEDRPGHDKRYGIDASKIIDQLGWIPEYNFFTGIKATINWYKNNMDWLQRIQTAAYQDYNNQTCVSSKV
ncbi:dTDP-glucose 4,6-dehydratase [Paenibacillus allorhizosphaerae]|uniref:dTDP-glucose 4,6-dehydratase n=1 Tax=Paenibacillus allorhizosphaerae TaxID=2849866 RepID=A0ABN7U0W0_9BACL|nr:dTDP-glucose 4,6-dehydratase [Paenibacillus allorhizosphaerae]CAG7659167.1 dTDP-glucose 4,6-dehydratase 2 [Paenibacillus allorhizosphaerae]